MFDVNESGDFESVYPFKNQIDTRVSVDGKQVATVRSRPVVPLGWRRLRWLKRKGMVVYRASFGPPSGSTSQVVGCVMDFTGDVVADVVVDGECDGHLWCHKSINIGHSTRQTFSGSVSSGLSSCLSSRLSFCPPLVRPAPVFSSFPSLSIPSPPAHSALSGDDVGDRLLSVGAGASVVRPCSSVLFVSVDSSYSSLGSLHSVGPCK